MKAHLSYRIAAPFFVVSLMLVTMYSTPAQSASASASASASPSAGQYEDSFGSANAADADAGDVPPAFSNNVTNGAEAVNDAMADGDAPTAQASSPDEAVPTSPAAANPAASPAAAGPVAASPTAASPSPAANPAVANPAAEDLTVLPDTGGASFLALGSGLLLVAGGLCARRMLRR